jgi:hypothetical protein
MIGHTVLREIVSAYAFTPVAGSDLRTFVSGLFFSFLLLFVLQQAGIEDPQCDLFIAVLGFFLLTGYGQAAGYMSDPHCTVGGIEALPAGTAGAEHIKTQIFRVQIQLNGFRFGHHRNGHSGCVDTASGFCGRDPLYTVDT